MRKLGLVAALVGCSNKEPTSQPAVTPAPAAEPTKVAVVVDAAVPDAMSIDAAALVEDHASATKENPDLDKLATAILNGNTLAKYDGGEPTGGMSAHDINAVMTANADTIRTCYTQQLKRSPTLAGKLSVRFEIRGDGSVKTATINTAGTTLHDKTVERCVTTAITRLRFPATGSTSIVNYPFIFQSAG